MQTSEIQKICIPRCPKTITSFKTSICYIGQNVNHYVQFDLRFCIIILLVVYQKTITSPWCGQELCKNGALVVIAGGGVITLVM